MDANPNRVNILGLTEADIVEEADEQREQEEGTAKNGWEPA